MSLDVALIHGFGRSTFSWLKTMPLLAKAGYRVLGWLRQAAAKLDIIQTN